MIVVRTAVAKSGLISLTPIFAQIAVNAAKNADRKAYTFHIMLLYDLLYYPFLYIIYKGDTITKKLSYVQSLPLTSL